VSQNEVIGSGVVVNGSDADGNESDVERNASNSSARKKKR